MKKLVLKVKDIQILNETTRLLQKGKPLTSEQTTNLVNFLLELPEAKTELSKRIPNFDIMEVSIWDVTDIDSNLEKWEELFENIPGFDSCPGAHLVTQDLKLKSENVIITAFFAPTLRHNEEDRIFEVHLRTDGTAIFWFPTGEDVRQFPKLFEFIGTWKEAYYLLIETMKKGWPMEEFPEELQRFLLEN
jgi:hypothetical protein